MTGSVKQEQPPGQHEQEESLVITPAGAAGRLEPEAQCTNSKLQASTHVHNGVVIAVDQVADGLDHAVLDAVINLCVYCVLCVPCVGILNVVYGGTDGLDHAVLDGVINLLHCK